MGKVLLAVALLLGSSATGDHAQLGTITIDCDGSVGTITCTILISTATGPGTFEWRVDGRVVDDPGRSLFEPASPGTHRVEVRPAGQPVPVGSATVTVPELPDDDDGSFPWWLLVAPISLVTAGLLARRSRR